MATRNWNLYPYPRSNMGILRNFIGRPSISDRVFARGGDNRSAIGGVGLFALGCVVGASVGLLFAPRRGKELRHQLQDRVSSMTPRLTSRRREREVGTMSGEYGTQTSPSPLR